MSDGAELFTTRLHLRRPLSTDAAATITIAGDWEVARQLSRVPYPYGQSDFDHFLADVVPNEPTWAIVMRSSNELVGMVSLIPNPGRSSAELGYYIGSPYWGLGLATEAGQAIVRFGLDRIGYAKLTSRYYTDNPASGRVLAKLHFQPVGVSNSFCQAERTDKPSIDVELAET